MNKDIFFWTLIICPIFTFGQQGISVISGSSSNIGSSIGIIGSTQHKTSYISINQGIQQMFDDGQTNDDKEIEYDILLTGNKIMSLDVLRSSAKSRIVIVTRDGKMVYQNDNYLDNWRGTNNHGETVPDGSYYFILTVTGREKPIKGSVTLIR